MALGKNILYEHKQLSAQLMHIFAVLLTTVPALSHIPELHTVKDAAQTDKGK